MSAESSPPPPPNPGGSLAPHSAAPSPDSPHYWGAGGAASPRFLAHVTDPAAPPVLRLDALAPGAAAALRAAAAAVGARAALGPHGALVAATRDQHAALAARLAADPAHAALGQAIAAALAPQCGSPPPPTRVGAATWAWGERTYVMGILNVASDSFSGDALPDVAAAIAQARAFAAAGADLLDVGGESTRPGAPPLPADDELARVLPVIAALRDAVALPISIDTYKASVAEAALAAGACVVNDVTGLRADPAIAAVAAAHGAALVLTHNRPAAAARGPLGSHNPAVAYDDLLGDVLRELRAAVAQAEAAGVPPEQLWIDPGIGFGKTREQNLALLDRLGELRALGRPILLGTSRKSVIGLTLGLPVDQRVEGTAATVALGIRAGADVVRVHDVRSMALVARLADAITRTPLGAQQGAASSAPTAPDSALGPQHPLSRSPLSTQHSVLSTPGTPEDS